MFAQKDPNPEDLKTFSALFLPWDYSVPHPCTSSQKLFMYFSSQQDWTRTPHSPSEPPPPDTNHAAWKDQGGEVCFSQETHCQEGFKQLLLGEKGGTLNKEISQRRGSGREEPEAQGDFCQRAILLIRITELLSLPDTSLQMVKRSLLALWKCLYHLVIQ